MAVDNGIARPMEGPERAAIRQIAHEVLKTFRPGYAKVPSHSAGVLVGGMSLVTPQSMNPKPTTLTGKVGRNDRCHCGSGKKYKHCHGRAAR